jgi:hypothetical protein
MKKIMFAVILLILLVPTAKAQVGVQEINMQDMIWYVLPFYMLTLTGLSFFLHKLIRPKSPLWPVLTISMVAILWASLVTMNFQKIQNEQLGGNKIAKTLAEDDLSPKARADLKSQQEEQTQYWFGSFYTTAMPNIAIFVLSIVVHYRQKSKD